VRVAFLRQEDPLYGSFWLSMRPMSDGKKGHMLPVSESTISNLVQKVEVTAQTENDRTDELPVLFLP
jgi:transposase-like protein